MARDDIWSVSAAISPLKLPNTVVSYVLSKMVYPHPAVVNVARFLRVDPEEALNFTSEKFIRRFQYVESTATQQGKRLEEMSLEEMDMLWVAAKSEE